MILDRNDPTGLGLFSKCARHKASKNYQRPVSAVNRRSSKHQQQYLKKKNSCTHFSFEKQQSRDQRQRRFKQQQTPSAGHYNPVVKTRPKLVWDVLKVFSQTLKKSKATPAVKESIKVCEQVPAFQIQKLQSQAANTPELASQDNIESLNKLEATEMLSNSSRCLVNMSRMTGRKEQFRESRDWGNSNIMSTISYVRGNISKNIRFDKQPKIARKPQNLNPTFNYTYDYKIIKPKQNGFLDFSSVRGRESTSKTQNQYSYQHYQYDNYVWWNNSRVFPSTKTNLVGFGKQANRYKTQNTTK